MGVCRYRIPIPLPTAAMNTLDPLLCQGVDDCASTSHPVTVSIDLLLSPGWTEQTVEG